MVDIVAFICAMPLVERVGASKAQLLGFAGATAAMLLSAALPAASVSCALVCRFCLDVCFTTVYILIIECYRPEVRVLAIGVVNAVSRLLTFAAPLLGVAPLVLTRLVLGVLCGAAAVAMRRLQVQPS